MQDPDLTLVRRAQAGDKKAMASLVEQYYEKVYVVCFGVLREREAARDVTQDLFLKLQRDLVKFAGQSKFSTWLYRVATNGAIDAARKRRDMLPIDDGSNKDPEVRVPGVIVTDTGRSPRREAEVSELHDLVLSAVEELSPDHRAVLVLREWQELSYDEIAEVLGVEPGTVMSRLFYARKKLRDVLDAKGVRVPGG